MKTLPEYITFATPELALAVAAYLESKGWVRKGNMEADRSETHESFKGKICLSFRNNTVGCWGTDRDGHQGRGLIIPSMQEFLTLLKDPVIMIGEYPVDFSSWADGIKVGCQPVSWKTLDSIMARRPKP